MLRIANAPCSWGVIENTEGERTTWDQVLDQMAETGFEGTELGDWGFMPSDPTRLRSELSARNLALLASWVSVRLYDTDYHDVGIENAIRTARLLAEVGGDNTLIVIGDDHSTVPIRHDKTGRIRPEYGLNEAGWDVYTTGMMRVAEAVKAETGLRSAIHPHGATYVETPAEITEFLKRTDPALVGMVFDTGHYHLGGGDAVKGIKEYADRILHVHFKDFDPSPMEIADEKGWGYQHLVGQGMFSELGKGVVDFPGVADALTQIGYDRWVVVEQDVLPGMGSPKESAQRNRDYLKRIGL